MTSFISDSILNSFVDYGSIQMPLVGFGMTHNQGGVSPQHVLTAYNSGYRLFDTATRYGTEHALRILIDNPNIPRESLFITTKLWPSHVDNVLQSCLNSCKNIGVDTLDLYLMHWPDVRPRTRAAVWRDMERLLDLDRVRAIGVSNFMPQHIHDLYDHPDTSGIPPLLNQIECHVLNQQRRILTLPQSVPPLTTRPITIPCPTIAGVPVQAYSPLAKGVALQEPTVLRLAQQVSCTPAQLCLAWLLHHGIPVVVKSKQHARCVENALSLSVKLDENILHSLGKLDMDYHCTWDPTNVP